MPVLQANEIRKSFKEGREVVNVLNGVSLSLEPGEVTALEGPSGSGKTTLLSIIGCILTPNSGDLFIDGERVDPKRSDRLPGIRRRAIGFVFQQFNLFPALTALIRRFCSRTSPPRISTRKWGCRFSICFVRWRNRRTEHC